MTLNDFEKRNYIKDNFHQSFELTLNTNIRTTETVNLIIPIDNLTKANTIGQNSYHHNIVFDEDYDATKTLNKYEDSPYEKNELIQCVCDKVLDGDTIDVLIPYEQDNQVYRKRERVRLVGINTPEEDQPGFDTSKRFLEQICFTKESLNDTNIPNNKKIYLKLDTKKITDNYNRILAVLIVDNKNINEVLLKEGLAEIMYIPPSEFNPFEWGTINTSVAVYNFTNDDISILSPYFNSEMTNIVFTPKEDLDTLYRYEIYKNVIYIKLNPFSQNIIMHLLPKSYDCSDSVLIFKDEMIKDKNIEMSNDYRHYKDGSPINSYYQINNEDRDRTEISQNDKDYNYDDWGYNTYCDFSYDISKSTRNFKNIEICAGYSYNNSTPYYSIHYTGIRDNTSYAIEDRCTLIDANYDKIENCSNNVTQFHYDNNNKLYVPKKNGERDIKKRYGNIDHLDIGKLYHKRLKYINDILYAEEEYWNNNEQDFKHGVAIWTDISKEE